SRTSARRSRTRSTARSAPRPTSSRPTPGACAPRRSRFSSWMDTRTAIGFLARAAVTAVVLSSAAVLLFVGILPRTGAYRTLTVLSGSMRPAFAPGDMVVASPVSVDSLRVGDILVYAIPIADHHVESHRIVRIISRRPLIVTTKGDANNGADPW